MAMMTFSVAMKGSSALILLSMTFEGQKKMVMMGQLFGGMNIEYCDSYDLGSEFD